MQKSTKTETAPRYRAFICYSQHDRRAAENLHRRLENYRVPRRLSGQTGRSGIIPGRLSPIFRDRDELAASADIGERLHDALARSDFLIVLCSPASARSRWVEAEIETFCAISPENRDRVLAVLIAGEPEAIDPALECFPAALRRADNPARFLGPRYPLAADLREGRDNRADAELRLMAALLGVEFDELKRRHQEHRIARLRVALALVAALGLAFATLAGYALHERTYAQQSAIRAKSARDEAEKLVEYMLTDLRKELEQIGKSDLLEPANEKVRAYYQTVSPGEEDVEILRRRAAALQQYGTDLRIHKKGAKTLEVFLATAKIRERLVHLSPSDASAWQELAETHRFIALQRRDDGDLRGALQALSQAMSAQTKAAQLKPDDFGAAARIPALRVDEATVLLRMAQATSAAAKLEQSLKELAEISAKDPKNVETKNRVASAAWQLGNAYKHMGNYGRAEAAFRDGIAVGEALREAGETNIFALRWLKANEGSFGQMLQESGKNEEALPVLRASLQIARDIAAIDPTNLSYQDDVATDLINTADALVELKRAPEALVFARESVELRERAVAKGTTDLRSQNTLALALATLSSIELELQHQNEALASARRSIEVQQNVSQRAPEDLRLRDDLGYMHARLAACLLPAKQFDAAAAEYRTALMILTEILSKDTGNKQLARRAEQAEWLLGLGSALSEAGKREEAGQALRDCVATIDQAIRDGLAPQDQAENRKRAEKLLAEVAISP
jgi:tetratricopeptide (TPR) repeat protein